VRVLSLACSKFTYLCTKPLVESAVNIQGEPERVTLHDNLVLLTTIEKGDSPSQIKRAAERVHKLSVESGIKVVTVDAFVHLSQKAAPHDQVHEKMEIFLEHLAPLEIHHTPFGWQKELSVDITAEPWSHHLIHT